MRMRAARRGGLGAEGMWMWMCAVLYGDVGCAMRCDVGCAGRLVVVQEDIGGLDGCKGL